jgi:hypothetical protein
VEAGCGVGMESGATPHGARAGAGGGPRSEWEKIKDPYRQHVTVAVCGCLPCLWSVGPRPPAPRPRPGGPSPASRGSVQPLSPARPGPPPLRSPGANMPLPPGAPSGAAVRSSIWYMVWPQKRISLPPPAPRCCLSARATARSVRVSSEVTSSAVSTREGLGLPARRPAGNRGATGAGIVVAMPKFHRKESACEEGHLPSTSDVHSQLCDACFRYRTKRVAHLQ